MPQSESLNDRRPLFLRQVVGNLSVTQRLSRQMAQGTVPNRAFFHGPTGAGKTTVARILARHYFCENRFGIGDPCGRCENCLKDLGDIMEYEQWTAARLERNWGWWESNGPSILARSNWAFFLDEAQDLSELHQKDFYDQLESARALVVFATTHKQSLKDALVNRFGANAYEMRRPATSEVVDHINALCEKLGVQAPKDLLELVAAHYGCDLRKAVDFVYCAAAQAPGKEVTAEFVAAVLGIENAARTRQVPRSKELLKL